MTIIGAVCILAFRARLANAWEGALGQNTKSEECYYHAWHMIPGRFYPKYLLAKLFDETGQKKKALDTANELLNKKIKVQSTAIEEIKDEMDNIIKKYKANV